MKLLRLLLFLIVPVLVLGGCGRKQITELQRKEAAHLASEADFALTLRDWARAETALAKAVAVCPDAGEYWISLGSARMRLGKRDAAREAYKGALAAYEAEAGERKKDPEPALRQAYVLALLGRANDGRAVLEKTVKRFPDNRDLRTFMERKQYDQMLADPAFKQIAL